MKMYLACQLSEFFVSFKFHLMCSYLTPPVPSRFTPSSLLIQLCGLFFLYFFNKLSQLHNYSPGWPRNHYLSQDGFKLKAVLLPWPLEHLDYKHVVPCLVYEVLGLGKPPTYWAPTPVQCPLFQNTTTFQTNMCCPNIFECVVFHWSMTNFGVTHS